MNTPILPLMAVLLFTACGRDAAPAATGDPHADTTMVGMAMRSVAARMS